MNNLITKRTGLTLFLAWLLAFSSYGADRSLTGTDLLVARGQTNCLTVVLNSHGDENALGFSLGFDTNRLTFSSARLGSGANGASWFVNQSQLAQGRVGFAIGLSFGQVFPAGSNAVLEVCFAAAPGGPTVMTPVQFGDQPIGREIADAIAATLTADYTDATVTIQGVCQFALTTNAVNISASGGLGGVGVTTDTGCNWSVSNTNSWITITSGTNVTGSGSVSYAVAANPNETERIGRVQVAGQTFTITQAGIPTGGMDYWAANPTELAEAVSLMRPGDTVILRHGVWWDADLLFHGNGTAARPLTLRAEIPGQTILSGNSRLRLFGNWLVVEGLMFTNGYAATSDVIAFREDSGLVANNSRLTECAIINYNPPTIANDNKWVSLYGVSNRVDHCYLEGKTNEGATVAVWVDSQPNYHRLDHNFFGPRPALAVNGGETIRVGTSDVSLNVARCVVEQNYFYQCNGDAEFVSNKSCENTYRYNTFVECEGALTLRHGNRCVVEDNYFFGHLKPLTGGVRIVGEDHRVFNNYFAELSGTSSRAALSIMQGLENSPLNGYFQVQRAVVAFNTLVDCKATFVVGLAGTLTGSTETTTLPPVDCTIANNLAQVSGRLMIDQRIEPVNLVWQGNLLQATTLGIPTNSGILLADPRLLFDADGLWRPGPDSPALGTAQGVYDFVTDDMEGQIRPSAKDIGCDQASTDPVINPPLTEAEAGPAWRRKSLPVLDWPAPTDITFPTALGTIQLNATANVPGTFAYEPGLGTLLTAGNGQQLSVTFTPTDTENYSPVTHTVTINVLKANPVIAWANPDAIVFGTPLGAAQFNATANVSGTFVYNPPLGTILNAGLDQLLSATFKPSDPNNYHQATRTLTLDVLPAHPVIEWSKPANISRGIPLGAAELNATASVPGAFEYTPPLGTILEAGLELPLSVRFTPDDTNNYTMVTATVSINVIDTGLLVPLVTWPRPADISVGTALSELQLNATADVPGTMTYTPPLGTVLAALHGQTLSVRFTPDDTNYYMTATATVPINVLRPDPMVRVGYLIPANRTAQSNGVTNLQSAIRIYRDWFRDQMERNGFGRKTFTMETEADGLTPMIHTVSLPQTDTFLTGDPAGDRIINAARAAGLPVGTPGQIWWLVAETHHQNADGSVIGGWQVSHSDGGSEDDPGWTLMGGDALALYSAEYMTNTLVYDGFVLDNVGPYPMRQSVTFPWYEGTTLSSVSSSALGAGLRGIAEAMGLDHDYRNDENFDGNLLGFGYRGFRGVLEPQLFAYNNTRLAYGAALALNVCPYFNPGRPFTDNTKPHVTINVSGAITPLNGVVRIPFSATDSGGLAAALLSWKQGSDEVLVGEMILSGKSATPTLAIPYYDAGQTNEYTLRVIDLQGNQERVTATLVPAVTVNHAPLPFITATPVTVGLGEDVLLDASATFDAEHSSSLLEVEWDLNGDGIFDTPPSTFPRYTTRYLTVGSRLVRARVADPAGAEAVSAPVAIRAVLCSTVLSPPERTHGYGTSTGTVNVETTAQCVWDVINTNDWITITSGTHFTGNGSVSYAITANPSIKTRTGYLLLGDQAFALTQEGVLCTFTPSPAHKFHGYGTTAGSTKVTTKGDCPWTVLNTNDWITLTSGSNYVGTADLTYALTDNHTADPRTGLLLVADQVFAITQWGTNCGYEVAPLVRQHSGAPESGEVNVWTSSACSWSAVNTNNWITLTSTATGSGSAVVTYTIPANPGPTRSGYLVIAGQAMLVEQVSRTRVVSVGDATILSGQTGCVPIFLETQGGENALRFSLDYDPGVLALVWAQAGSNVSVATLEVFTNQLSSGRVGFALTLPPGATFPLGVNEVAEVCFQTIPSADTMTSHVTFGDLPVAGELLGTDGAIIPASFAGANVSVAGTCKYALNANEAFLDSTGGTGSIDVTFGQRLCLDCGQHERLDHPDHRDQRHRQWRGELPRDRQSRPPGAKRFPTHRRADV